MDSAPAKANEAEQKNYIGSAKEQIELMVVNAKTEAYEEVYVKNSASGQEISDFIGKIVIKSVAEQIQSNNKIGKAIVEITGYGTNENVTNNAQITITTNDLILEGTITVQNGILTWGEIGTNNVMKASDVLPKSTDSTESPYVIYKAGKNIDDKTNGETNEILCRVLYNDDTHGLQLIAVNPVTDVKLGKTDPKAKAALIAVEGSSNLSELKIAKTSYNNAITYLNEYAEEYRNKTDGIAIDSRCVGSLATVGKNTSGAIIGFDKKNNPDDLVENIDNPTDEEKNLYLFNANSTSFNLEDYNGKYFKSDSNYTDDENRLKASGGIDAYKFTKKADGSNATSSDYYWLASRNALKLYGGALVWFSVCDIDAENGVNRHNEILCGVENGAEALYPERIQGLRPVFLLDSNVKLTGTGDNLGSESNPYRLKK